jgi:hypothetical protein
MSAMDTPAFNLQLQGLWRRGQISMCLNLGIAAMLVGIKGLDPVACLIYSLCIGTMCWLSMELILLILAALTKRGWISPAPQGPDGWPGWHWVSVGTLLSIPLAYTLGNALADHLTGHVTPNMDAHNWRTYLGFMLMSLMAAFGGTYFFYSRTRIIQVQAEIEHARRVAAETQLKLLEAQLEPHMLFNTLANLRALIAVDPGAAQTMLDHLIDFYRGTLQASRLSWHSIEAEFARTADYLALMTVRMGPRLQTRLILPDDVKDIEIPPLLLQPLIENAIKHGLEPQLGGGQLIVSAQRSGSTLTLEVCDSGMGLNPDRDPLAGTGFGLLQVRERLSTLYGADATLELSPASQGGTLVRVTLPMSHRAALPLKDARP